MEVPCATGYTHKMHGYSRNGKSVICQIWQEEMYAGHGLLVGFTNVSTDERSVAPE